MGKNKLLTAALSIFGIADSEFIRGFSEEQKTKLRKIWGEELANSFIAKFEANEIKTSSDIVAVIADASSSALESSAIAGAELMVQLQQSKADLKAAQNTIEVLSRESEPDMTIAVISNNTVTSVISKIIPTAVHNTIAKSFLDGGSFPSISASSFNIDEIQTEFGKIIRPTDKKEMFKIVTNRFTSAQYFTTHHGLLEWQAINSIKKNVLQAFTSKWTPVKGFEFKPLVVRNYHHKINVEINVAEVIETWLMYLYNEGKSPDQQPLVSYIIDCHIKPQILEDLELRGVWKGKYVAPGNVVDGSVPSLPHKSMQGIETQLVHALASQEVAGTPKFNFIESTINLETSTDVQILEYIDVFKRKIDAVFKTKDMPLFCSLEFYEKYKTAFKNKWGVGSGTESPDFGGDRIDFSRLFLTPIDGMYGSPILFATPKENLIKIINVNKAPDVITDIQRFNYDVKIFGEFWLGVGFALAEAVFAAVPASYNPQAEFEVQQPVNELQTNNNEEGL